jgi:Putative DNA-binding domain
VMLWVLHFNWAEMEKLHKPENLEEMKKARALLDKKVLDYVCNILKSHAYVDHTKEINSIYALVPIIVYVFHKQWQKLWQEEISKIIKRFYYSQIRVRYISQLPQKLNKDLSIVKNSQSPFDDLLGVIKDERPLTIDENEFIGVGIQHPLFGLMKWYFKSKWAVCLSTGLTLRKNMGKKYSLERDHIFAYSILKDNGYDINNRHKYALAQEITNRAILTQDGNRTKSNMDASIYLNQVAEQLPNSLKLQCIPEDKELRKLENFELFLKKRRQILAEQLNQYLEWLTITDESTLQVSIEDLIEEGESKYLEFKSSLRRDTKEWVINKGLEQVILKVISSFSNAEGGTLLIGVNDDGHVLWLQNDYDSLAWNRDEFELHLTNLISKTFGADFKSRYVDITFPIVHEQEICMIQIKPRDRPLYLEIVDKNWQKQQKFYVRSGNSSWEFWSLEEITNYIKQRF